MLKHVRHRSLIKRLRNVKLPKQLCEAVWETFEKWASCSGYEYTISRFKNIKADLISFRATGQKPQTPWIRKTKAGNFAGVFGVLQKLMITDQWTEVLYLMNLYTYFRSKHLTNTQWSKWIKSVESRPQTWGNYLEKVLSSPTLLETSRGVYPRVPHILEASPKVSHVKRILVELRNSRSIYHVAYENPQVYEKSLAGLVEPRTSLLGGLTRFKRSFNPLYSLFKVGVVGVTQEPGYKARFYFDPDLWIQYSLLPLKDSLMQVLQRLPWDCTHDQHKAVPVIQKHLSEGKVCHCFDLSDATNYFPFALQHLVLQKLYGDGPLVRLFASICDHGAWLCPDKKWRVLSRGQAMGLGPSFPLFAATHGFLTESLLGRLWDNDFFILGDDLVILNDALASSYQKTLEDLGIPYSPTKTIVSNKLAEFAGLLIESDRVHRIPKWTWLNRANCVDLCSARPDLISVLPPKKQWIVRWALSLPQPFGIGFNPKGQTLDQRCPPDLLVHLSDRQEEELPRELDLMAKLNQWVLSAKPDNLSKDYVRMDLLPIERLEQRRARKCHYQGWLFNHKLFPLKIREDIEGYVNNRRLPSRFSPRFSKESFGGIQRFKRLYVTYISRKRHG